MRKINRARILLIILFISLGFIALNDKIIDIASNEKAQFFNGDVKIQTSRSWTLSSFIIDDLGGGNYTWEQAALNDWCSGIGTWNDPYVIENITINGKNASSCLEIRNSNVFFRIENCTFYNSSDEGLFLEDVNNGRLFDNNVSFNNNIGLLMSSSSNITLLRNKINNNKGSGISINKSNNNTILGNNIRYNERFGININESYNNRILETNLIYNKYGLYLIECHNSTFLGNNVSHNKFHGIFIYKCNNNTFSRNYLNYNKYFGIDLTKCSNNTILGNFISNNEKTGLSVIYSANNKILGNNVSYNNEIGIYIFSCSNITIKGNIISYNKNYGIIIGESHYNSILDNKANYNTTYGIYMRACNNNLISGNDVNNNSYGVYLKSSNYNKISKNNADYNNEYGISIFRCSNITIKGNIVSYNKKYGIHLESSNNSIISRNNADYNNYYGIYLKSSNSNMISENNASFNVVGIYLITGSNNNTISGNNCSYTKNGIALRSSNNNMISGSDLLRNKIGLFMTLESDNNTIKGNLISHTDNLGIFIYKNSRNNLFYNNFFIKNDVHAKDPEGKNFWNNSLIGNYWDDYTDVDSDNDGIGDVPYYNSFGGVDYLPICKLNYNDLTVISPKNNSIWNKPPTLKILTYNKFINSIWYIVNQNPTKFYLYNNTTEYLNKSLWNDISEGIFQITFYINNTLGFKLENYNFTLYKDTQAPIINLTFPLNGSYFSTFPPSCKVHFYDRFVNTCWYSFNNLNNITFNNKRTLDLGYWANLPDGSVKLRIYTNDTAGNLNKLNITIFKDTIKPYLTINDPIEQYIFINQVPVFNLDISDASAFNIWYSLNDGRNISCAGRGRINAGEWNALPNANIKITFHVQDMAGNLISLDVYIQKKSTNNFFIFIIIGIIGGIMVGLGTYLKNINAKLKDAHDSPIVTKLEEELELIKFYKDLFAHDITNILSGINLNVELAEKKTKNNDYLSTINKLTNNAIKIISNVRKLTMNNKSHKSVDFIEIKPILYSTITNVKEIFKNRKIDVKSDHIPQDFKVYGNELLLDVFENILHNAVKYTYDKENIVQIEIKITKIDESKENFIKLEFRDHGIGIPDIMKKMTFNRTENNYEMGMGIGLSLVKKIVNDIGGKIWVEDRIKGDYTRGSNFIVLLRC